MHTQRQTTDDCRRHVRKGVSTVPTGESKSLTISLYTSMYEQRRPGLFASPCVAPSDTNNCCKIRGINPTWTPPPPPPPPPRQRWRTRQSRYTGKAGVRTTAAVYTCNMYTCRTLHSHSHYALDTSIVSHLCKRLGRGCQPVRHACFQPSHSHGRMGFGAEHGIRGHRMPTALVRKPVTRARDQRYKAL
jgi:hypothetical protein